MLDSRATPDRAALQDAAKYRVYRFQGRDLLAVPDGPPTLRAAAVGALPAATPRARLFRLALRGLVAGRLDRLVARVHDGPAPRLPGFAWRAFVLELERALGRDDLRPVVAQPRQASRARLYVHLFAPDGERIAFAKVAADAGSDVHVAREASALEALLRRGADAFRFPSPLASGSFDGRRWLLLAPLPPGSRPASPRWTADLARIREEIAGPAATLPSLAAASWWPDFERTDPVPALARELAAAPPGPVPVCRAHGDFVNWNVHEHRGDKWIFDWEAFCEDAPVLADEVRFALGLRTRAVGADPGQVAAALLGCFGRDAGGRTELARALAFLHARGVQAATAIARAWERGA